MTDDKQPAPSAFGADEALAFVEGFLLGLARRLDDAQASGWYKGSEAADDCRAVAAAIKRIGVPMNRPEPKPAQ